MSSHISISCPDCRREVRIRPEYLGRKGVCKFCGHLFRARDRVQISCPNCQSGLDVRREYLGRLVDCRHCRHRFVACGADGAEDPGPRGAGPRGEPPPPPRGPTSRGEGAATELTKLRDETEALRRRADEVGPLEAELRASRTELERLRSELEVARTVPERQTGAVDREDGAPFAACDRVAEGGGSSRPEPGGAPPEDASRCERLAAELESARGELRRLADQVAAAEADRQEAEKGRQAELERLARALQSVREGKAAAVRHGEELAESVRALEGALDRGRADREQERQEYQRRSAALEQEAEAARARPGADAVHGADPGALERRLAEVVDQLRAATERADRLDAELLAARPPVGPPDRDLALDFLFDKADGGSDEPPPEPPPEADDEAPASSRFRIQRLSEQRGGAGRPDKPGASNSHARPG